jgi:hypothetical protein
MLTLRAENAFYLCLPPLAYGMPPNMIDSFRFMINDLITGHQGAWWRVHLHFVVPECFTFEKED